MKHGYWKWHAKHGNCKQLDGGFDSDLCTCGCAAVENFVTPAEIASLMARAKTEAELLEAQTNIRALAHARAVNARAERKPNAARVNAVKRLRRIKAVTKAKRLRRIKSRAAQRVNVVKRAVRL